MATDLQRVAQLLQASLDPAQNKQAELALRKEENAPGYSLCLLSIVANDSFPNTIRLSSALYFKNLLKRKWVNEDGVYLLPQNEVEAVKREIIGLMIAVPVNIQSQLGDAIGIIAQSDFYERWDTLVDDLVSRLTADDVLVINGVLQVAHSIFKRWRPLFRSDALFTEINHVLSKFATPFLTLLENTDKRLDETKNDKELQKQLLQTLQLMMKLFYDLSCQDLPPAFEDGLRGVTNIWLKYLKFDDPALHTNDDEESGPIEYLKSAIFEVLTLYTQKYGDVFETHANEFVASSWSLLTSLGTQTKFDILVSRALQFLTVVAHTPANAAMFNSEENMGQVMEGVILPNLTLRESDLEMFEDEPIEFIRRDLEGSDSDTRRRAATDFLRVLVSQFEELITKVVLKYVGLYLSDYKTDPQDKWKSKDTAIYLYSAVAAKGVATTREGVKTVNPLVNVVEFFQEQVASDLILQEVEPLLKVDAIKYLYTFRSQLDKAQWQAVFPLLVQHLGFSNFVIYTYAAIAVERALALAGSDGKPVVDKSAVTQLAKDLLQHLFTLIEKDKAVDKQQAAAKIQENEFLMRCVMRVLIIIQDAVVPLVELLLPHFATITDIISDNPSNPRFYYYHFEAIGAVIRFAASSKSAAIESALFPSLASIVQNDIQDFLPYVLQLFAALIESDSSTKLPQQYNSLTELVLKIDLWTMKGNVPALVRLVSAIVVRNAAELVKHNQVEPVLGIFNHLLASKSNELQAFELLECILKYFPQSVLTQYYVPLFTVVLTKVDHSQSEALKSRFVRLYHFISASKEQGMGADFFISIVDQIQPKIFVPLYLKVILEVTGKLVRPLDRKVAVISLTKTLTDSQAFAERYEKGWGYTCDRLLEALINAPLPPPTDDLIAEHDVDDMAFGVGFTQLVTIRKAQRDDWPEIANVKQWVGDYLTAADRRQNGKIAAFVQTRLTATSQEALMSIMRR